MKVIFNCAGWINFRKLITPYIFLQVSFTNWCFIININIIPYAFPALLITYQNIIQNPFSMLIETCLNQKVPWNFLQSSMEHFEHHLNNTRGSMEFHGTWATKPQVSWNSMEFCPDPKFRGIPWNFSHTPEFHGIPLNSMELLIFPKKVPWNSMEFFFEVPWNSVEFHGTWWISYLKKSYFKTLFLVFDWWLDVIWLKSHRNATYGIDFNFLKSAIYNLHQWRKQGLWHWMSLKLGWFCNHF